MRFLTEKLDWARFFPNPFWVSMYVHVLGLDDEENAQVHLESLMMIKMEKSDSSQKPRICVLDLRFHQKNIPKQKFLCLVSRVTNWIDEKSKSLGTLKINERKMKWYFSKDNIDLH